MRKLYERFREEAYGKEHVSVLTTRVKTNRLYIQIYSTKRLIVKQAAHLPQRAGVKS
jgi:hypothetical protein